jgi:hypothetical protein
MPPKETRPEAGSTGEPDETFGEPDETFLKEWTGKKTTPVPTRVFQKQSLGIDEALLSRIESPRAPRIRSHLVDCVIPIGRRVLEVAIMEAVSQKELNPRLSEWEPEWSRIADASQDAGAAIAKLFRAIDPDGKEAEHFARFIRQSRGTGGVGASKAMRDARLLVAAKQIIGKLHADTLTRRDALVALYPNLSPPSGCAPANSALEPLSRGMIWSTGPRGFPTSTTLRRTLWESVSRVRK